MDKLFEGIENESPVRRPCPSSLTSPSAPLTPDAHSQTHTQVWMSHSDRLHSLPEDFGIIATTPSAPFAALAHKTRPIYGIQFHPEVTHSRRGKEVLERFIVNICGCKKEWTMVRFSLGRLALSLSWRFVRKS